MTTSPQFDRTLFVALPVEELARSTAFFETLGFAFDPAYASESSACMHVGEHASVMLLERGTFAEHSHRPVGDPRTSALALFTFTVPTREDVDAVSAAALEAGATQADDAEDHGFMYTRSFHDLDGHGWQIMWAQPAPASDPAAASA